MFDIRQCNGENAGYMAIGFFDSLHLGHRKVIERSVSLARKNGTVSSVFLFKNNIYELIGVQKTPLFSFEQRVFEIEKLGVDKVFYLNADESFLSLLPTEFIAFIRSKLQIDGVVCGSDFTFGRNGLGKAEDILKSFPNGEMVDLLCISQEKVSTSLLKEMLLQGDLRKANEMLGRPFSISKVVVEGRKDGGKNGFPTLNMPFSAGVLRSGVYLSETVINGHSFKSLTNIGAHPTYNDDRENAETYVLDYKGDLYGRLIEVRFLDRLRDIQKFESAEALAEQIEKDVFIRRNYDPIRTFGDR